MLLCGDPMVFCIGSMRIRQAFIQTSLHFHQCVNMVKETCLKEVQDLVEDFTKHRKEKFIVMKLQSITARPPMMQTASTTPTGNCMPWDFAMRTIALSI